MPTDIPVIPRYMLNVIKIIFCQIVAPHMMGALFHPHQPATAVSRVPPLAIITNVPVAQNAQN